MKRSQRVHADLQGARLMPREFFARHVRLVARQVLGKLLVRREPDGTILAGRIVETEAYLGADDAAAHSAAGLTQRNAVMFGEPGHCYVYFSYGMHYCANITCEPDGRAGCTLIRALKPVTGIEAMAERRKQTGDPKLTLLCSGPARLCQALGIDRPRDNGKDLLARDSDLQLLDDGYRVRKIVTTKRIGITKSADLPLRFYVAGSEHVSKK